jgi:hypothetical protein
VQPPKTEADKRTLERSAKVEERRPEETVDVAFDPRADLAPPEDADPAEAAPKTGGNTIVARGPDDRPRAGRKRSLARQSVAIAGVALALAAALVLLRNGG